MDPVGKRIRAVPVFRWIRDARGLRIGEKEKTKRRIMKERVKVMQDMYENRTTNKKAAGCTVIISGEMKEAMDKIIAKHPEYKSYAQAFAGVVERGIQVFEEE